jgi:hypothetical protein
METQPSASKWPWTKDSNMLVCNTEVNAGVETPWESMVRDQTLSAT